MSDQTEEYGEFPPGTIVLAKLKSFPPWPAIVIPNQLIPADVSKSKPKKPTQLRSSRGKRKSITPNLESNLIWCVRFLKDDNYMWATQSDLNQLSKEQIETTLRTLKSKNKVLKSAYEMALNPPDLDDFIIYGSDGKPVTIDNEADDDDFEIGDADIDEDEDEEEAGAEEDEEEESEEDLKIENSKKRKKPGPKPKSKPLSPQKTPKTNKRAPKRQKSKQPIEPDTSEDEDFENDLYPEPEQVIEGYVPSSKEYTDLLKKNKNLLNKIFVSFEQAFLRENINLEQEELKNITNLLDQLYHTSYLPKSQIIKNNIHKLFINILKRNDLSGKNQLTIRSRVDKFIKQWFDLDIQVNENWRLEEEEDLESKDQEVKEENVESDGLKENGEVKVQALANNSVVKDEDSNGKV
ncbi:hypothetical protein WICMUC_004885 [Wickerhamomyces mucosus]|uniref:PWWP domain-containing protein n=1 Tax=Wickerhamomyces mucosus TaxID=1378264 RepID=A0A9P8PED7_9ASCO|nr:hypothetical protein WICMUC_004885 [Wickerhamomyces mucosus]